MIPSTVYSNVEYCWMRSIIGIIGKQIERVLSNKAAVHAAGSFKYGRCHFEATL